MEGRSDIEDLLHYFESIQKEGDYAVIATDENSEIRFLFIVHQNMLDSFAKFPEVMLADSTYNTNKHKLPLLIVNAVNGLGGSECIAYAFLINETKETYTEVFEQLRKAAGDETIEKVKTIVVDYDMSEISSLETVFPGAHVQLWSVHVERAFKREITEGAS